MASDEQAGYSNSAMTDDSFDVDLKPANDGLNLRIDTLPMTHVAAAKTVESVSNPGGLNGHKDSTPATSHSLNDETTDEIDICSDLPPANIRRDRPFSATGISRKSTGSSRSRVSMSPSIRTTEYSSKTLFAYRPDALDKAIDESMKIILQPERDGEIKGSWLLTEIDHWNIDHERIVFITEKSLIVVKYDFIQMKMLEAKQIPLVCVNKVQIGDLTYPPKSLMSGRDYGGIRIHFGSVDNIWFSQRWNPWSRAIPYVTFTHHVLAYNPQESETVTYNADDMAESLVGALAAIRRTMNVGEHTEGGDTDETIVEDGPIVIESYASLLSVIFNQSRLGFYLERGGVSY
jgi:hypothetical protein